jgi:hypothetical protein
MLYGGVSGGGKGNDPYKDSVIDTMVAEIQSVPGEDRCVLLLGYEPQIREMFQVRLCVAWINAILILASACEPGTLAAVCH